MDRTRVSVSEALGGLEPGTTYHVRLCAQAPDFDAFCGDDRTFTTEPDAPPTELSITATPALYPAFDPAVIDYVTRCGSDPVAFEVEAPAGTEVAVDGAAARSGRFTESVQLAAGQRAAITATTGGTTDTFHVRCLPADFPAWTHQRSGQPSDGWTLVSVVKGSTEDQHVVFFDNRGVPVWWYSPAGFFPIDAKLLSDDSVAFAEWILSGFNPNPALKYQVRRLDGTLVRTLQTVGVPTDFHDLQELPNGNYLLVAYKPRDHVDLSAYGESSDSTVLDAEIQEITPGGQLVWSWNSKDHIDLDETGRWWNTLNPGPLPDGRQAIDHIHINAVEPDGNGLLISTRHTDSIYRINRTDGHVEWKLGGTDDPREPDRGRRPRAAHHARRPARRPPQRRRDRERVRQRHRPEPAAAGRALHDRYGRRNRHPHRERERLRDRQLAVLRRRPQARLGRLAGAMGRPARRRRVRRGRLASLQAADPRGLVVPRRPRPRHAAQRRSAAAGDGRNVPALSRLLSARGA